MKKVILGIAVCLAAAAAVFLIMGGYFFPPKDAKDLAVRSAKKMESVKSFGADEDLDLSVSVGISGLSMDLDLAMNSSMEVNLEPFAMHMEADMVLNGLGISETVHSASYAEQADGKLIMYSSVDDGAFRKQETAMENSSLTEMAKNALYVGLSDGTIEAQMKEGTVEYEGGQAYVTDMTLTGEYLKEIAGYSMTSFGDMGFDPEKVDWNSCEVPAKVYVDSKTYLPVKVTMDCKSLGKAVFTGLTGELGDALVEVTKFDIEIRLRDYNAIESIVIPEEAKQAQ